MKTGLRFKFTGIVLLAVVPFLIYASYDYVTTLNENRQTVMTRNQDKAVELAHEIDDFIDTSQNVLYSLALHPALINHDSQSCDTIFAQLLPLYPLHLNILAADMNGNNFASAISPELAHQQNYRDTDWFIRGSKGTSVVSELLQSKLFQQASFMITMPVFALSGDQTAVLGFPVNLNRLQEHFVATEALPPRSTLSLIGNNAIFLLNTADSNAIGKPCPQQDLLRDLAQRQSGSLTVTDADGINRFYSYATVETTGWKILIGVPLSDFYAEANRSALKHLFFFIAISLAASLTALSYSRKLGNRVEVLTSGLSEVAGGNFDCRLPVRGVDEIDTACDAFNRMTAERQKAEQEILHLATALEKRVESRTAELTAAKNELESFAYAVSHDLQAPVRHLIAYSQILLEGGGTEFSPETREYLLRISRAGLQMRELITHLLALSRLSSQEINRVDVDLSRLCHAICQELAESDPERRVQVSISDGLTVAADPPLLDIAMHNLIGNAWKYTRKSTQPRIEIGETEHNGRHCFYIRDNGTGFDMAYRERLFTPFQRLHSDEDFEGSGVGLATVMRIMQRHGGTVWAESSPGNGAVFYFTLTDNPDRSFNKEQNNGNDRQTDAFCRHHHQ
jgi:signal transduction histidine kinase